MHDPLKAVGSVNGRGFILGGINVGNSSQIHNRTKAKFLPYVGKHQRKSEPFVAAKEENRFSAE